MVTYGKGIRCDTDTGIYGMCMGYECVWDIAALSVTSLYEVERLNSHMHWFAVEFSEMYLHWTPNPRLVQS